MKVTVIGVAGGTGSGKSTLLYALSGMDGIDGGEVSFEGRKLSGLSDDALSDLRRSRMGFVFQQPALLKNLNLLDNIMLPQMRDRRRNVRQLNQKARDLMEQMGIGDLAERDITQASGGQLRVDRPAKGSPSGRAGAERLRGQGRCQTALALRSYRSDKEPAYRCAAALRFSFILCRTTSRQARCTSVVRIQLTG